MSKQVSKLTGAILAHLRSMDRAEAAAFYETTEAVVARSLRTKKPTMPMAEIFMERVGFTPEAQPPQPDVPPQMSEPSFQAVPREVLEAVINDVIIQHPYILSMVTKMNELIGKIGELSAVNDRLNVKLAEVQSIVSEHHTRLQGPPVASVAPPRQPQQPQQQPMVPVMQPTAPLGTPPPPNGGGWAEPETISTVRPSRATVPIYQDGQVPHFVEPVASLPVQAQPINDGTGSIAQGTAFDWLSGHKPDRR